VHTLPADHDSSNRAGAFAAALDDPMAIGVFYRRERPTLDARVRAMQQRGEPGSVEELLDGFAVGETAKAV
jgi:hypothetical protein